VSRAPVCWENVAPAQVKSAQAAMILVASLILEGVVKSKVIFL
jgi:hypothetical protein